MRKCLHIAMSLLLVLSCGKDDIVPMESEPNPEPEKPAVTPEQPEPEPEPKQPEGRTAVFPKELKAPARVYINTPHQVEINSKHTWVEFSTIKILGDRDSLLFEEDSLKIKGRGNSTWYSFPKKPYAIKLDHQADFFGTGKSKRYVLLANWMDRTLLRNDVAFEAARRTSLEWTPTGTFVDLYLNGQFKGSYWLGEKINVEGSKFEADYLFTMDTSDSSEWDFRTPYGFQPNYWQNGMPVQVKYPDRDDFTADEFKTILGQAQACLNEYGLKLKEGNWEGSVDLDSFVDWYLVHELCYNLEPNHPKSCFFHVREGRLIAGPIWDFDWYTFIPDQKDRGINRSIYFQDLFGRSAFRSRLKERWNKLKPSFESLGDYVDARADWIRESERRNHGMWPCYPNNSGENGMVNGDEALSFQDAVNRLKRGLSTRISALDKLISTL